MRIRITGKRVAKGNTGIVYDVLYIVSRTKELGLPADLLSMPEEPSKRGEMVSRSSAEARDRTAMEARFTAKKREYESSIAREKWQVKYDIQKDNRMVVSGGGIKRIMRGDCLGLSFFTRLPEYKSKHHVWLLSFIVRLSGSELELPNYVYAIEKSR